MNSFMVSYCGNRWLFKHKENAILFMESREGATCREVGSSLYYMQFSDSVPSYSEK